MVGGLVTPDQWHLRCGGELVADAITEKDLKITWAPEGGVAKRDVSADRASAPCLGAERLAALEELATRCEPEAKDAVLRLIEDRHTEEKIASWIRANCQPAGS